MDSLTLTIDLQISDDNGRLARELLRIGADDTREMLRWIDSIVANTALTLLIEAQQRQIDKLPPAGE